ncbi:MAG TPA: glycosyltransferase, partial [Clostridia bacterium]|nr:glycosyltransferase [Clostridia bacterium]
GQDVLLAALPLCGNLARSTRIEFVGGGWMKDQLRKTAAASGLGDRCTFTGIISRNEVLQKMAAAKISVVPSRHEAFGIVNVESMSVGTPVVASHIDGIPEIVRDGVDGFLVPPGDAAALADKLSLLLSNPSLCDRLGQNARQRFLNQYEDSAVLGPQADWLHQLVHGSRPQDATRQNLHETCAR